MSSIPPGMSLAAYKAQLPAPGTENDNGIIIVDRLLEPQTIVHFIEACLHNELPNGGKFSQPKISDEDDMRMIMTPYSDWADPAFHRITTPVMEQLMIRIGSTEDGDRLTLAAQPLHHMKTRIWEGMIPMSDNRWRALELDDPKHHRMACEHLGSVVEVFKYLNYPTVITNLRTTFNLILEHLTDFDNAINIIRNRQNKEEMSMANAWVEFIEAHYEIMTTRAHKWVIRKITPILEGIMLDIHAHQPANMRDFTPEQFVMADRFHDLMSIASQADCAIFMPMEGYLGYVKPPPSALYSPVLEEREKTMMSLAKTRRREKEHFYLVQSFANGGRLESDSGRVPVESLAHRCIEQKEAFEELRIEFRGTEKAPGMETWIREIHRHSDDHSKLADKPVGFIIYRLTYEQSDEIWDRFKQALEADLADWGDGIEGSDTIKDLLKLHWLDGDALGFEDRDIEAAKRHFETFSDQETFPENFNKSVFLAIDSESVTSYLSTVSNTASSANDDDDTKTKTKTETPTYPGENTGFILVIDAEFDPEEPDREEESPGYSGVLRILGNLVWNTLYAMQKAQAQRPRDLWPSAMEHPDTIYVGPVVQWMRNRWAGTG